MEKTQIIMVILGVLGIGGLGMLGVLIWGGNSGNVSEIRDLMGVNSQESGNRSVRRIGGVEASVQDIKKISGRSSVKKGKTETLQDKLFKAGFYSAADRKRFLYFQIAAFGVGSVLLPVGMIALTGNPVMGLLAGIIGVFAGYAMPVTWVDKQIRKREDEIMYFLPLVIEQVSIGVSSSLDIGPCVAHIIHMADERDSHNPVTEMLVHVEKLMRSGMNLEESLIEIGSASGIAEIKHAFMFLAQCSKHGGEVTKQLQELADAVMVQREVQVEGKITALPVKATGPLLTVFAGFFALLFAGLLVRLMTAFGSQ